MPTYRLTVAYDGTDFHGWAPQPGLRTVAAELAQALEAEPRELTVAGRTDTGVHARANVVSLAAGRLLPAVALNDRLPADIAVLATASAADSFDARRDARNSTAEHGPGRVRCAACSSITPFPGRAALDACAAASSAPMTTAFHADPHVHPAAPSPPPAAQTASASSSHHRGRLPATWCVCWVGTMLDQPDPVPPRPSWPGGPLDAGPRPRRGLIPQSVTTDRKHLACRQCFTRDRR